MPRDRRRSESPSGLAAELARVEAEIRAAIDGEGRLTLPGLRDRLGVSRRQAKAFLDYFDAVGLTRRRADDTRVLRRRPATPVVGAVICLSCNRRIEMCES